MELPPPLRAGVDRILEGVPLARLSAAADRLSGRYRGEVLDGRLHLSDADAALAYLAVRLPATFAALRSAMEATALAAPDFTPRTLLDFGAGPGTALWAARDTWASLSSATLVEASAEIRALGAQLAEESGVAASWRNGMAPEPQAEPQDLVTCAYVLNEVPEAARPALIGSLWGLARGVLLIVEPGTPGGWARLMAARRALIEAGAHILAPCPHTLDCPLVEPAFCRFSRRVARTRLHRLAKGGEAGWEDETFAYLAAARFPPVARPAARVLTEPRAAKGRIELTLCEPDGTSRRRLVTRREAEDFHTARRSRWGDIFPSRKA